MALTPHIVRRVKDLSRLGLSVTEISQNVGVSRPTLYRWLKIGEYETIEEARAQMAMPIQEKHFIKCVELQEAYTSGTARSIAWNLEQIFKASQGGHKKTKVVEELDSEGNVTKTIKTTEKDNRGDWKASAWYLNNAHSERFSPKVTQDLNANIRFELVETIDDPDEEEEP